MLDATLAYSGTLHPAGLEHCRSVAREKIAGHAYFDDPGGNHSPPRKSTFPPAAWRSGELSASHFGTSSFSSSTHCVFVSCHRSSYPRRRNRQRLLELAWRTIAERRMQAFLVIDFLQELLHRCLGFLQIAIFRTIDFLIFESLDKTFRQGIVIDVSAPTHADPDAMLLEYLRVIARRVLDTTVGVVHQSRLGTPAAQRHVQSLQHECSF